MTISSIYRALSAAHSALVLIPLCAANCAAPQPSTTPTVSQAWQQPPPAADDTRTSTSDPNARQPQPIAPANTEPVATVNGRVIPRHQLVDLLIRSRGLSVLEQLIGLEVVLAEAARRGITVTDTDIDREHQRALQQLVNPLAPLTPGSFDRQEAERILDAVLAERGMSRRELDLITRRNAYLRQMVETDQAWTEQEIDAEYRRLYGPRVEVRHIQLGSPAEAATVRKRLEAGEDFAELARQYSANPTSAAQGGLLRPFSLDDDTIPTAIRTAAADLDPGQISGTIRAGEWYHIIRLERKIPGRNVPLASVRDEVITSLRQRGSSEQMFRLFEKLFREATIRIHDPRLAEPFFKQHPGGSRKGVPP